MGGQVRWRNCVSVTWPGPAEARLTPRAPELGTDEGFTAGVGMDCITDLHFQMRVWREQGSCKVGSQTREEGDAGRADLGMPAPECPPGSRDHPTTGAQLSSDTT